MIVSDKKSFEKYIKFMKDESEKAKKERISYYENLGGLNADAKAKFIVSTVAPYLYNIVSRIEEVTEDKKNHEVISELENCFSKIKEVLKKPEQISALDNEFKELNLQNTFSDLQKVLTAHKNDIYSFTSYMFSTIFENLKDGKAPDTQELREMISSPEIYEFITKKTGTLTDEEFNIGKTIINALVSDKASVNTEIVGRVYAYVKSGWAKADLFDQSTLDGTNSVHDLNEAVGFLQDNRFNLTTEDRIKYEKKLAESFNNRLNEIAVKITYSRDNQSCTAGLAGLKADRTAGSGTADIAIQEFGNPSKLISIYCTANHSLHYTNNNKVSWSLLSHAKINNNYLKGKSISQVDTGDAADLKSHLTKEYYNTKIEEFETINISPATLATIQIQKELSKALGKPSLSKKEKSLIDHFPIFDVVLRYKPDDNKGTKLNIEDIFTIKENVVIASDHKINPWDDLHAQFKYFNVPEEKKEHFFYNNILIPYVEELWGLMYNKDLKESYIVNAKDINTNEGRALSFINNFPEFFSILTTKVSSDINKKGNLFTQASREKIIEIANELTEHKTFNSEKSLNTTEHDLNNITNAKNSILINLMTAKKNRP